MSLMVDYTLTSSFLTSANESRVALIPGGFRDGAALLCTIPGFCSRVRRFRVLLKSLRSGIIALPSSFPKLCAKKQR